MEIIKIFPTNPNHALESTADFWRHQRITQFLDRAGAILAYPFFTERTLSKSYEFHNTKFVVDTESGEGMVDTRRIEAWQEVGGNDAR